MNNVNLIGRLTADPEFKTIGEDTAVANFRLAVNRPRYGNKEQETDFFNIVAWRKSVEFVDKYFSKGKQVYVTGRLQNRSWDGADGKKCYATEVVALEVGFADSKNGSDNNTGNKDYGCMPDGNVTEGFVDTGASSGFDPFA